MLIENFRSDSAEKLGLTPESLLAQHPRLIVCSISGFGRTGPLRDAPGYDFAIQALSGLMNITGPVEGPPYKVGVAVADVLTGLYASTAILACLRAREQSGHGYAIDLALLDLRLAAQVNVAQAYLVSGTPPPRQGNAPPANRPLRAVHNGRRLPRLERRERHAMAGVLRAAGAGDLAAETRFATNRQRVELRNEVVPRMSAVMKTLPTAKWEQRLTAANVPHAVVSGYDRIFASDQIAARGMKVTVRDPAGNPVDLIGDPVHVMGSGAGNPPFRRGWASRRRKSCARSV